MKRHAVLIALAIWASGCSIGPGPKEVMGKYLDATHAGRYQEAYDLLSSRDREAKSLDAFSRPAASGNDPLKAILGTKDTYQVTEVESEGDKARATVEIASPDYGGAFAGLIGTIFSRGLGGQLDEKSLEKEISDTLKGRNLPTIKRNEYYDLVKEGDGWKVFMNYEGVEKSRELIDKAASLEKRKRYAEAAVALGEAAKRDPRNAEIPVIRTGMERKAAAYDEKRTYIDRLDVADVRVGQDDAGRFGVFGELRNRGDRTLREVEITVYFLDRNGNYVHEETHRLLSAADGTPGDTRSLKPNYARKFGYRIAAPPSDWAKQVKVAVTDLEFRD